MAAVETSHGYGSRVRLEGVSFAEAEERATAALKEEGFGVLSEIDIKAAMKEKLDLDYRQYKILGACNPNLAHQGLEEEYELGLLLPCNVIVYEDEEGSVVAAVDPKTMLDVVGNESLARIAEEAEERLGRALEAL
ncbi:MAG: DUF302 domain-containing protein [Rubrobacteraceae bacterium]